jgi:circadian clock protein KaiC
MAHSNQIREFLLTSKGVDIVDVYTGPAGVLTGSARLSQETLEKAAEESRIEEIERLQRDLERKRKFMEAQAVALQVEFETEEDEIKQQLNQEKRQEKVLSENRQKMAHSRKAEKELTTNDTVKLPDS